ncbi:response regulator [Glaciihabitans arcticus]|uniref:response regulator n=1 Tax=Glaciihabitans arcticus TaxID=2668039 RepID=UPI001386E317|nr:response regulator [Glaciihabitans arcticus]
MKSVPPTVVIADDDPDILSLVAIAVRKADLELVARHENGASAWESIRELSPTLVVLDVTMPGLTGLEITRNIRADVSLSGTRIVLLSAGVDAAASGEALSAGADVYLTKPFSPSGLAARLVEIVR